MARDHLKRVKGTSSRQRKRQRKLMPFFSAPELKAVKRHNERLRQKRKG